MEDTSLDTLKRKRDDEVESVDDAAMSDALSQVLLGLKASLMLCRFNLSLVCRC